MNVTVSAPNTLALEVDLALEMTDALDRNLRAVWTQLVKLSKTPFSSPMF
jgi:hypothetical protein